MQLCISTKMLATTSSHPAGKGIIFNHFFKYKKGEYIVKKVLKDPTYGNYILKLVEIITQ